MSRNKSKKGLSLTAAAWFYSQPGFHGNIRETVAQPEPPMNLLRVEARLTHNHDAYMNAGQYETAGWYARGLATVQGIFAAEAAEVMMEEGVSDEPEWTDSHTTREMHSSIGLRG